MNPACETVLRELDAVAEECREANSDGYGALPIAPGSVETARRLILALPSDAPIPSAGADPEGHVTLEWYSRPRRVISLSVSPDGTLHYAALIEQDEAYGTEGFAGAPPQAILELVRRVMGQGMNSAKGKRT